VEGSEDEEPSSTAGLGLANSIESSDSVMNGSDTNHTQEVLVDKTNDQDSEVRFQGGGDADAAGTEAGSQTQTQSVTAEGDTASPDDNLPPAVLALKDAGNTLFRNGQYSDALDKYNAAIQLLG